MVSPAADWHTSTLAIADDASSALIVAWRHPETRAIRPVGVLSSTHDQYRFEYLSEARRVDGFRPFLGFPDLGGHYTSARLFPLFRQRIVDSSRPDFQQFITMLGLDPSASPLKVLGRSGGSRLGDSIFLVRIPDVQEDGSTRAVFFVHGVRHTDGAADLIAALNPGDVLALEREPGNPKNSRAMLVTTESSRRLGWVPDLLAEYAQTVLTESAPLVRVVRANGVEAPPNLRLLVELRGKVPAGYSPFPGWELPLGTEPSQS